MNSLIGKVYPYSLNKEKAFMWIAEYLDGTLHFQFNKENNDTNILNKKKTLKFGLAGAGIIAYYDIPTGIFHFDGKNIEFIYKTDKYEYNLTNQFILYNDCIMYEKCYSDMNSFNTKENIYGYSFGYKTKLNINNVEFYFKSIFNIDNGKPFHITNRIVSSKDLNGEFIIRVNKIKNYKVDLQLKEKKSKEIDWMVS